jgi:hypothetical protein
MISGQTLVAGKATVCMPAESHALSDLESFGSIAESGDRAGHLMPGHEGVFGHPPIVIEHGEIRVAKAAIADLDFNFFGSEFPGIEAKRFKLTFG